VSLVSGIAGSHSTEIHPGGPLPHWTSSPLLLP
jgi:hypothetical protein